VSTETTAACAHCGGTRTRIVSWFDMFLGRCDDCSAKGPQWATDAEALAAWNHRPAEKAMRDLLRRWMTALDTGDAGSIPKVLADTRKALESR
jgi:hypothetical protein